VESERVNSWKRDGAKKEKKTQKWPKLGDPRRSKMSVVGEKERGGGFLVFWENKEREEDTTNPREWAGDKINGGDDPTNRTAASRNREGSKKRLLRRKGRET